MKRWSLLIIGFLFLNINAQQTGDLKGNLIDDLKEPVGFANVILFTSSDRIAQQADIDGRFSFLGLRPEQVDLLIVNMTDSVWVRGITIKPDEVKFQRDILVSNMLSEIVIETDHEGLINEEGPGKVNISYKEIQKSPLARDMRGFLAVMVPDIQQNESGEVFVRGSRGGGLQYFLNGSKMTYAPGLPASSIKSYTVYTSGIPAKYGDTLGGVVVIETKSYQDLIRERNIFRTKDQ